MQCIYVHLQTNTPQLVFDDSVDANHKLQLTFND